MAPSDVVSIDHNELQACELEEDKDKKGIPKFGKSPKEVLAWALTVHTTTGYVNLFRVALQNIRAAVLVAMISMALSIGLGIASGSNPVAGLRTAIWAGIVGGIVGSSPFNIMGPAGALSSMLSSYSQQWGPDILPWIAIISGGMCCLVFLLGLQKYCLFMPKSVFEGFTISVGVTIGLKQLNYAFGLRGLKLHETFLENVWESISHLDRAKWGSMVLFFPETVLLYILMRKLPRVPWLILIPLLTIIFGYCFRGDDDGWDLPTLKTQFGELPNTIVVIPPVSALKECSSVSGLIIASASVCFVSVLETLISAKIAEFRCPENDRGPFNETQEIIALSGAQLLAGIFGGLPPTGVFVRTSANQLSGANHPLSQFMNAILVLIITVATMPVFSYMPLASIAALLVISSIRMMPISFLRYLWKNSKPHFVLCLFTAIVCLAVEPTIGLLAGTLVAYLMQAMRSSYAPDAVLVLNRALPGGAGSARTVCLAGAVTYANSDAFVRRAGEEPLDDAASASAPKLAVIDLQRMTEADTDGAQAIERLAVVLGRKVDLKTGLSSVYVTHAPPTVEQVLTSSPWFCKAHAEGRVVESVETAVAAWMRAASAAAVPSKESALEEGTAAALDGNEPEKEKPSLKLAWGTKPR